MSRTRTTGAPPSLALAHDSLTELGGAERVVAALAAHYPAAPILTSAVSAPVAELVLGSREVRTSFLRSVASDKGRAKALFPFLPLAFRSLAVPPVDLLLTSSSGYAHHLRPGPGTLHAWYCHTPPRFLWDADAYFRDRRALAASLHLVLAAQRRMDRSAAARIDLIIANSRHTADRVRSIYQRDAPVLWPPVPVDRFRPTLERTERFLVVSRLLGYKRIDLAIAAAGLARADLDIVGEGPDRARLERMAGPGVRFLGRLPDAEVQALLARCTALLVPGIEDLGLTIVEAQASGRPPIAFAGGGALETVQDGVSGFLVDTPRPEAFAAAMRRSTATAIRPDALVASARRLDTPVFLARLEELLGRAMEQRATTIATGRPVRT